MLISQFLLTGFQIHLLYITRMIYFIFTRILNIKIYEKRIMKSKYEYKVSPGYNMEEILNVLERFDSEGTVIHEARNRIKKFSIGGSSKGKKINVKLFRKKSFIVQLFYRYIKGSKGRRSYIYARKLAGMGIGTPEPVAYFDF